MLDGNCSRAVLAGRDFEDARTALERLSIKWCRKRPGIGEGCGEQGTAPLADGTDDVAKLEIARAKCGQIERPRGSLHPRGKRLEALQDVAIHR